MDDAAAVRNCVVELQEYERAIDLRLRPGELIAAEYLTQMLDRCSTYAGRIFVADCGGVVAGFVTVLARIPFQELDDPPGEYALISDLVVLERFRRRGSATALLNAAEQYAYARGASELRIGVLSGNHAAHQLYIRAGFSSHAQVLAKRFEHTDPDDPSNGYEQIARQFMATRNPRIGAGTVSDWSKALPHGAHVLDLGCGHGNPVSDTLTNEGFKVYGVDASPTLVAAYRHRFPDAQVDCATVEESTLFDQTFDGIVAWGLMFLLTADTQVLCCVRSRKRSSLAVSFCSSRRSRPARGLMR